MTEAAKCPRCYGVIGTGTGGFTEAGYVCRLCQLDQEGIDAVQRDASNDAPPWYQVALNVILLIGSCGLTGILGPLIGLKLGVFVTSTGPSDAERAARREADERAAARRRKALFLRRDGTEVGPYHLAEIRELESTGAIRPDDEFIIEGMEAWRPMSAFSPTLLDGGAD